MTGFSLSRLLADPRLAITEDGIVCLICRATFRQLTNTHLAAHATTANTSVANSITLMAAIRNGSPAACSK